MSSIKANDNIRVRQTLKSLEHLNFQRSCPNLPFPSFNQKKKNLLVVSTYAENGVQIF